MGIIAVYIEPESIAPTVDGEVRITIEAARFLRKNYLYRVRAVTSKLASSFTDGRWSPTLSQSADPLSSHLEVPPDGEVVITFNSAVDIGNLNDERLHARLIAVAHYRPGGGTKEDEYYYVDYDARKCLDAEVDSLVSKGPDVSPFTAGDQDRQRDEVVGCAVLSFTRDQLRSGQEYELLIKKKIRYNKMSGPTGQRKPVESPSPHVTADRTEYLQAATLASSSTSVFSRFLLSVGEVPNDEDPDSQESTEENLEEEDSDGDDRYHGPDGGEDGGADQAVSSNRPESSGFVYSETTLNLRQFEKLGGGSVGLQLTGLRPFKFFGTGNSSFRSMPTVRYRRLTLLLPHGLNGCQPKKHLWPRTCWSSWTSVDARSAKAVERLAGQIDLRVEGSNQTVNFTLHLRDSITAVLTSRDLRPGVNYVLSVGGSVMVRDKFNQPLQPSVLAFRMDRLQNSARLVLPRDPRVWLIEDSYLRHQLQERATVHLGTAVQFTGSGRSTGVSSSNEDMEVRQVISNDFGECLRSRPEACLATLFDNFTTARENYHGRSVKEVTPSQTFPHPNLVYSFKNGASSMSGSFKAATPQPFLFHGFTTTSLFLITVKSKDPVQLYTSTSHFLWGVSRFLVRVAPTVRHEAEKAPALLVQALDLETAYPLTRSMISVYGKPRGGSVVLLGDGMTDVRGFALVPVENPAATMKLILVVVPAGQVAPYVSEIFDVPSVWFAPNTAGSAARPSWDVPRSRLRLRNGEIIYRKDLSFVLLSDRSTYRPGESILLSGFQFLRVESWDSGSRATTLIHDAFGLDPGDLKIWLQVTWQTPEGRGGTPNGVPPRGSSRDNPIEERASADRVMRDSRGAVSSTNRGSAGDAEECSNVVVTLDEFGSFVATVNVPTKAEHGLRAVIDVGIFERGGLPEENAIMAGACMLHPESLVQTENIVQPTVLSRPNIVIFAPRRTAVFLTEVNVPPFVRHDGQLLVKGVVKTHDGLHLNGQQVRLRFIFDVPAFLLTRFGRNSEDCLVVSFALPYLEPLPLMQLDLSENGLYPSTAVAQNPLALKYGPFVVQQEIKVVVSHPVRELHVPAGAVDLRIIDSRGLPRKTFDGKERVTVQVTVHKSRLGLDGLLKVRGWQRNVTSSSDQRDGTSVQSARPISASSFSTPTSASAFLTFPSVPSNTSVNPSDSEETGDGSMFLDDLPLSVKGQVLLTMVDKRFLDSASAPVFPLADQLDKRAAAGPHHGVGTTVLKWSSSLDQVCSYEGFRFINEVKQRRLATDPWFDDLPWPLLPRMFYNSTYSNEYLDDTAVYEKYAWPLTGQFPPKHASSLKKVRVSQRGLFMAEWGQVLRPDPAEAAGNDGVWDVTPKASGEPPNGEEQEDLDILEDVRPFHGEDHDADYELQFLPRTQPIIGWRAVELVDIGRGILRGSLEVTLPNEATAHAVRAYTVIRVSPAQTSSSTETIPGRVSDESPSETHSAFAATDTSRRGILVQDQQSFEAETMARERYSGTALMVDSLEKVFQIRKSVAVRAYAPSTIRREDVALVGVTLDAGPNLIGKGAIVKLVSTSLLTPLTSLTPRTQRVYIERPTQQVLFHVAADRGFGTAEAIFSVGLGASTSRLSSQRESLSDWFTFPSLPSMGTTFEASMARSSLNDNGAWSKRRFRRVVTVKVTMEVLPSLRRMTTANLYPVEALNISLDDPAVEALGYNTRIGLPLPRPVVPDIGTLRLAAGISGVSAILFRLRELIQTRLFVPYENRSMDWFQRPYNGSDLLIILFGEALMRKAYGFQDAQVAVAADRARTLLPGFYSGDSSRGFLAAPAKTVKGANAPLSVMLTMLAVFVADAGVTSSLKFQRRKFVVAANRYIRMMASTWNQNNEGMTLLQYIGPALIGTLRFVLGSSHRFGLDLQSEHALSTTSLLPQTQTTREDICDKLPPHILWALLVMKRENPTAETHPVESSCIRAMIRLFRRRGLKGYIALGVDTDEPNTNTVHSLMLLLLTSRPQWTQEYAEEIRAMMIYLYGGGRKPPRAFMVPGLSRWSLVLLLLAIEQWDRQLRNVTDQNLVLEVQARESSEIDGYPLIDGRFYSHHRGPVERSIGWRELEKKVASRRNEKLRRLFADEVPVAKAGLAVLAVGKGTAIVSTLSDFMPSRPVVQPTYEGCLVQKRYHLLDAHRGYCKPDSTLVVNSGDRVCVFITVTFKSTAKLITVRDWLPAGLQPLDEVAEGFSPQSLTPIPRDQAADCAVTTPFLEGHCKKYIRGQAIEWVCESLPPGTHSFAVLASANFPGFYEVSLSTAFVYVLARRSVPGDQAGSTSFSRTLQGTSGAAHKAFAVLPINHGTEDVLTMKQIDPFTIAGLPTPPLWFLEGRPKICPTCELGTVCSPALGECVSEGF
ncbi:conserved hypothetical protein [Neospora caninum Liverpool]|uniref:Bacterial alpha-2-macroglobulin MG10 domain-containing protein n=1 Tax=Neospora caninum (strain Liverpool) TaxID=572307 RepID=F0VBK7_NEOCL|nr:conserved hypothetical protein [Neospora caninum Liverpool]CBZ50991.1 conserved hypothetical protein [Neospora caninum Liverpool]|eukprot:XP_003881024.1 conserved hypothetical protein [Neospora caninum Liverpool]